MIILRQSTYSKLKLKKPTLSTGITTAVSVGSLSNTLTKKYKEHKRVKEIDKKIGRDYNMKDEDRDDIDQYKVKTEKSKQLLHDILDDSKSDKEKADAEREYIRKESLNKTSDKILKNASRGSRLGRFAGIISSNVKNSESNKTPKDEKTILKGTLIGLGAGVATGTLVGGTKSLMSNKKYVKKLKKVKNKEKELDKIKVSQGKMTEHEFVKKHGGNK